MDTVVLDGVQYVKASTAAKRFRYTTDYIGQLCRGKKIDARLVGRTWFVNPESLKEYKQRKYTKDEEPKDTAATKRPTVAAPRAKVEPVTTAKDARLQKRGEVPIEQTERHLKVHYEPDEEALIPTIHKRTIRPSKRLRIEYVDPKRVKVAAKKKAAVNFKATKLPDVALSGKLKVSGLEEPTEAAEASEPAPKDDKTKQIKAISDKGELKKGTDTDKDTAAPAASKNEVHLKTTLKGKAVEPIDIHVFQGSVLPPEPQAMRSTASVLRPPQPAASTHASTGAVRSASATSSFTPQIVAQANPVLPSLWVRISPLLATLLATAAVLALFAASAQVIAVGELGADSSIVFRLTNLMEYWQF